MYVALHKLHSNKIECTQILKDQHTFSTTDVSLNVRYNPVISDEKRLPYSLFRKKRYQTGVGNKAR